MAGICLLWNIPNSLVAQDCSVIIRGQVLDESTGIPMEYAGVYIQETKQGVSADSLGYFKLEKVCTGRYHIQVSHIGCENENLYIHLTRDTFLYILLHHHAELLNEIAVHGSRNDNSTQIVNSISKEEISRESNKNFAELLEKIAGVSTIKNGSGIAKPVIHGLYGNRIAIVNNGLIQAGQQWGNDHAPEIDAFMVDHLTVVKGAGALAYGGNGLGGIILAENNPISPDPHLHGLVNYIHQSNGRGHTVNAQVQQHRSWASWRLSGTFKAMGDHKTPDYFLTNTGKKEKNLGFQLEKKWSDQWNSRFQYSLFTAQIGILRGSHIGNLSDLESAIGRPIPFFTKDQFSYQTESPRQSVRHHLVRLENKLFLKNDQVISINYGGQLNERKEFDVRRSGRSDLPALSLNQFSHFLEGIYNKAGNPGNLFKTGAQFNFIVNTNDPETGILPLIPNYQGVTASLFGILQQQKDKAQWEMGLRYDLKSINAVTISKTLPRTINRYNPLFHNLNLSIGNKLQLEPRVNLTTNLGYVIRSPEANELYSFGLHQGVSGLEEGNPDLRQEKSLKAIASLDALAFKKLFFQVVGYWQYINDYIYLQPQKEYRLTIRGAFPVFSYLQTDASIWGFDMMATSEWNKHLKSTAKISLVSGQDRTNHLPLVYIPPPQVQADLQYSFGPNGVGSNSYLSLQGKQVFKQNRLEAGQDLLETPGAYALFSLEGGTGVSFNHSLLKFSFQVENLFNTTYREYLNRLRYFADEPGINISLRVNYSF